NVMDVDLTNHFPLISRGRARGNFAPYSKTWSIGMERTVARFVHLRVNYQHNDAGGGILLTHQVLDGNVVKPLGAGGWSPERQFEVTAKLSGKGGQQMLFSYIRSKAQGYLNTFNSYVGDFPVVPIRDNYYSNTRGDIPDRFLAWGFINMPWKTRLAPIFEY